MYLSTRLTASFVDKQILFQYKNKYMHDAAQNLTTTNLLHNTLSAMQKCGMLTFLFQLLSEAKCGWCHNDMKAVVLTARRTRIFTYIHALTFGDFQKQNRE